MPAGANSGASMCAWADYLLRLLFASVACCLCVACRGYNSPLDISMKMERLLQDMPGVELTPFSTALQQVFPASHAQ